MFASKRRNRFQYGLLAFAVSLVLGAAWMSADFVGAQTVGDDGAAVRQFTVAKTFDGAPFAYRIHKTATKRGYSIYRLTYPSPIETSFAPNNTIPADYYLPDNIQPGDAKRPAVICLHILGGNFELVDVLCSALATRGIPAIMFKLPYYGERATPGGRQELARNGKRFVEMLPQCFADCRRTYDVLASRPEIDAARIGVSGISLGGIVAASTAGADPRFERAALILAGGDMLNVIHHANETSPLSEYLNSLPDADRAIMENAIIAADPLTRAPGLRDRAIAGRVLMINATEDDVIPPAATKKLAHALGISDRVVWLDGLGHYTAISVLPRIVRQTVDFFADGLPENIAVIDATEKNRDPLDMIAGLLSDAGSFLATEPNDGNCHLAMLSASVVEKSGKTHNGEIRLVRGAGDRFRVDIKIDGLVQASFGQAETPWMATREAVFLGALADADASPAGDDAGDSASTTEQGLYAFIDPIYRARVKMVTGGVATLNLAPSILEQVVRVEASVGDDESQNSIRIVPKEQSSDDASNAVDIVFESDLKTPRSATFNVDGVHGTIQFTAWRLNGTSHESLFTPPGDLPVQEVNPTDLHRIFAAMFNFLMEKLE